MRRLPYSEGYYYVYDNLNRILKEFKLNTVYYYIPLQPSMHVVKRIHDSLDDAVDAIKKRKDKGIQVSEETDENKN